MNIKKIAIRASYFSIVVNVVLAAAKFITGIFGNSFALIADAIESTTDIFSSILVLFGIKFSTKPPDKEHPYGHGRIETLVTFVVVGFLLVSATFIIYQSIENIQTPHETPKPYTLIVLVVIIALKEFFYRFISKKSEQTNSSSLKADAWHHRSDAITSLMAFIGISIALYMGEGYETADDWAALFAAGFIIFNAYTIFRPALGEVLDENLHSDLIKKIRKVSHTVEGVIDTEKCHVRKTGMTYLVDLHLTVSGQITVAEGHDIAHNLKNKIQEELPEVADVLIHVEPDDLQSAD